MLSGSLSPRTAASIYTRAHTNGGVQQRTLLRRVLRRVLETAFRKVLRRVLRRHLAVGFSGKKGSEKGAEVCLFESTTPLARALRTVENVLPTHPVPGQFPKFVYVYVCVCV